MHGGCQRGIGTERYSGAMFAGAVANNGGRMENHLARECPTGVTLHLTPEAVWEACRGEDYYLPEAFADEGFVHCTDGEPRVLDMANRYYRNDPREFVLLDVDLSRVSARTVYEDPERHHPHIFGPIERGAITRVRCIEHAAKGSFSGIGEEIEPDGPG